jgi:glycosyltransferase involved in cell wall biosynthesis
MVPAGSLFLEILAGSGMRHSFIPYDSSKLPMFYGKVFFWLLQGKYDVVYLNEAGHNKYINVLAGIFRNKRFFIHIRIKEDTEPSRWKKSRSNVQLITISQFIQDLLPIKSTLLYDSFSFSDKRIRLKGNVTNQPLRVGIIGRISYSKGVTELIELLNILKVHGRNSYEIYLFGDEGSDIKGTGLLDEIKGYSFIKVKGFVRDQHEMYSNIDVVLHLSKTEPLGRIFFEAIEEGKPLIGFNAAGIGEIGKMTGLSELLVEVADNSCLEIFKRLEMVRQHYSSYVERVVDRKEIVARILNIAHYSNSLDKMMT